MRIRLLQALVVTLLWGAASLHTAGPPVGGRWLSEGYGLYFEVSGSALTAYEITAISCVPSFTAKRTGGNRDGEVAFTVVDRPTTYIFRSGGSSNRRSLHMNGAASDIVVHRVPSAPAVCAQQPANTPLANFDVFAQTWAEQYGFFDLKHADWPTITSRHRERLSERTTPRELFQILRDMIEPFEDAHTSIRADDIGETWSDGRKSATWLERSERPRAFEVTQKYLRGPLRSWCNGQLQYGRLDSGVAYMRLKSFSGYGAEPGFESGLRALEEALDAIFADAPSWRGLVIDVRINGGGDDPYGLAIASRLTASPYVA